MQLLVWFTGVHMIDNIGRQRCSFTVCLLGTMPFVILWSQFGAWSATISAMCSVIAANTVKGRRWKRRVTSSACVSALLIVLYHLIVLVLILAAVDNYYGYVF